jgi:peptidoglycan hydrolase CwlO-like protein
MKDTLLGIGIAIAIGISAWSYFSCQAKQSVLETKINDFEAEIYKAENRWYLRTGKIANLENQIKELRRGIGSRDR